MTEVTWKDLAKTVVDKTKISEEIDAKILAHNTDPSAHSQTNEALKNHIIGEILDHANGSVTRAKVSDDAFILGTEKFDKGAIMEFTSFDQTGSGTYTGIKTIRKSYVYAHTDAFSVVRHSKFFPQQNDIWDCADDLEMQFNYFIGTNWAWTPNGGGAIYLVYSDVSGGGPLNSSHKGFEICLENQDDGSISATASVANGTTLSIQTLAFDLVQGQRYSFTVSKIGNSFDFYINGVWKATIVLIIPGTVVNPYLVHSAVSGNAADRAAEGTLVQVAYYFPYQP